MYIHIDYTSDRRSAQAWITVNPLPNKTIRWFGEGTPASFLCVVVCVTEFSLAPALTVTLLVCALYLGFLGLGRFRVIRLSAVKQTISLSILVITRLSIQ